MKIIRDNVYGSILLKDDFNNKILELGFFADEFIWRIFGEKIIINKNDFEDFYNELNNIMNNDYYFYKNNLSYKNNEELVWYSDTYGNYNDKNETDSVNRLIIKKDGDNFIISAYNPFFEKLNVKRDYYIISFSPAGNGMITKNLKTGFSFQDDMVFMFQNLLHERELTKK